MTWNLYLFDADGDTIAEANHFESSFSVDMDAPGAATLRDALVDRPELKGVVGVEGGWESVDGEVYPRLGTTIAEIEVPEEALERVGSALVEQGLADSYELRDE